MLVALLLSALDVQGSSQCPEPAQVEANLLELVAPGSSGTVDVEPTPVGPVVRLWSASGRLLVERVLPADVSCDALARAAAAVVAAWQGQLLADLPPARRPAPPPHDWIWAVGGAAEGSWTTSGLAPGAEILGQGHLPGTRFVGQLDAFWTGTRSLQLNPGQVTWNRSGVLLGPGLLVLRGPLELSVAALGALAVLSAEGGGFSIDRAQTALEPGAAVGLQAARAFGSFAVVLHATPVFWLATEQAQVHGVAAAPAFPQLELLFSLAILWRG